MDRLDKLLTHLRQSLVPSQNMREADLVLYEDGLLYLLHYRYYQRFVLATFRHHHGKEQSRWHFYREFCSD